MLRYRYGFVLPLAAVLIAIASRIGKALEVE